MAQLSTNMSESCTSGYCSASLCMTFFHRRLESSTLLFSTEHSRPSPLSGRFKADSPDALNLALVIGQQVGGDLLTRLAFGFVLSEINCRQSAP